MIEPQQLRPCRKCNNLLEFGKENRNRAYMREIGQPIRYSRRPETGMSSTSRFFQCPECGQLWQEIEDVGFEDDGPGGHRKSLHFVEIMR